MVEENNAGIKAQIKKTIRRKKRMSKTKQHLGFVLGEVKYGWLEGWPDTPKSRLRFTIQEEIRL